jgi:hypothetical protein
MASGTDGELITYDASGNPAKVAVGTVDHVLTSGGVGVAPTFQAAGGGISDCSVWELSSTLSTNGSFLTSNLAEVTDGGYGRLGSAMTASSGVFTFPSTGVWEITFFCRARLNAEANWVTNEIWHSEDGGSTYNAYASGSSTTHIHTSSATSYTTNVTMFQLDVTSTANFRVKFWVGSILYPYFEGWSDSTITYMQFKKLGET